MAEQQDLKDIQTYYQKDGGEFWIAKSDGKVIGTLGLQFRENHCAAMKRFFVDSHYRLQKIGLSLYQKCFPLPKKKTYALSSWIRPLWPTLYIGFTKRPGFIEFTRRSFPSVTFIRIGIPFSICWIYSRALYRHAPSCRFSEILPVKFFVTPSAIFSFIHSRILQRTLRIFCIKKAGFRLLFF